MPQDDPFDLRRFLFAQDGVYDRVLRELRAGRKQSHWMWFVFPQLAGLGGSAMAKCYAISGIEEARAYLDHPILGARLRECIDILLGWAGQRSAEAIMGGIDAMKLRSCCTLFERAVGEDDAMPFATCLDRFFDGQRDPRSLA